MGECIRFLRRKVLQDLTFNSKEHLELGKIKTTTGEDSIEIIIIEKIFLKSRK